MTITHLPRIVAIHHVGTFAGGVTQAEGLRYNTPLMNHPFPPHLAHDAARLAWPMDWTAFFGRSAPLFIEIGFGNADFLLAWARRHPEANLLGVEISLPSIRKAEQKIRVQQQPYVQLVQGDARAVLWGGVAPATPANPGIAALTLNFPDPWHKTGHHQRKLINDDFLALAASRMLPGATLDMATDDPGYQEHIAACMARTPYFVSRNDTLFLTDDPTRVRTKYELKALREGRVCHYFQFVRNDTEDNKAANTAVSLFSSFPTPQEHPMPHAILQTPLTLDQIAQQYQHPFDISEGNLHIRYLRPYHALSEPQLLLEVHLVEEPLPQRVALQIHARPDKGELLIGLHDLGFPRPTFGVHRAIAYLAAWLVTLVPDSKVIHHNLQGGLPQ
jgi:tRNA (guanine-N7-)-methyltransferase